MSGALAGRSVLITGAGAGVGRAIALAGAAAGANIVVAAPRDNGAETVSEITKRGGSAHWVRCDVTLRASVDDAVGAAVERYGRLDVVVHNATSPRSSEVHRLEDVEVALWNDHVAVSLRGAFHCAQAALPWLQHVNGRFILMTSPAGIEGSAKLPVYGAVKGAIRGFVKSLAKEWGPLGITVNCISPLAESPAMANAYLENPELEARLRRLVPLGRIGDAEADIAPAVIFLASDAGRYVTGQTLVVDGGRFTGL